MAETDLTVFQEDIASRLLADDYFSDITVVTEAMQDPEQMVARALAIAQTDKAGHCGVCAIVLQPDANIEFANPTRAVMETNLTIRVLENVQANRKMNTGTGKSALSVATRISKLLHHYAYVPGSMLVEDKPTIAAVDDPTGALAYDVRFMTGLVIGSEDSRCATPSISASSSTVPTTITLTCTSPADASIYYTTDGTHPYSGNTNATLYSAPFEISLACTLRVIAHYTGYIASSAAYGKYT